MADEKKKAKWGYPLYDRTQDYNIYKVRLSAFLGLCGVRRFVNDVEGRLGEEDAALQQKFADLMLTTLSEDLTRVIYKEIPYPVRMIAALDEELKSTRTANFLSAERKLYNIRYYIAKETMSEFFTRFERERAHYESFGGKPTASLLVGRILETMEYNELLLPAVASMRSVENLTFEAVKARFLDEYSRLEARGALRNKGKRKRPDKPEGTDERLLKKVKALEALVEANAKGGSKVKRTTDKKNIICFKCGQRGHYQNRCPNGKDSKRHASANSAIIDSGASESIVADNKEKDSSEYTVSVEMVNGTIAEGKVVADVRVGPLHLKEAIALRNVPRTLISVAQLCDQGWKVNFTSRSCTLRKDKQKIVRRRRRGLYRLPRTEIGLLGSPCELLHARLGHLSTKISEPPKNCPTCILGKIRRHRHTGSIHPNESTYHLDTASTRYPSLGGSKYFTVGKHKPSNFIITRSYQTKDEISAGCKKDIRFLDRYAGVQCLHSDQGTEFKHLHKWAEKVGILSSVSGVRDPQQNGVAERSIQTVSQVARCLLIHSRAPYELWAEAIVAACKILNALPGQDGSPAPGYALKILNKADAWKDIRTFGCLAVVHSPKGLDRFESRTMLAVHLYSVAENLHKVYFPRTRKCAIVSSIEFHEDVFPFRTRNGTQKIEKWFKSLDFNDRTRVDPEQMELGSDDEKDPRTRNYRYYGSDSDDSWSEPGTESESDSDSGSDTDTDMESDPKPKRFDIPLTYPTLPPTETNDTRTQGDNMDVDHPHQVQVHEPLPSDDETYALVNGTRGNVHQEKSLVPVVEIPPSTRPPKVSEPRELSGTTRSGTKYSAFYAQYAGRASSRECKRPIKETQTKGCVTTHCSPETTMQTEQGIPGGLPRGSPGESVCLRGRLPSRRKQTAIDRRRAIIKSSSGFRRQAEMGIRGSERVMDTYDPNGIDSRDLVDLLPNGDRHLNNYVMRNGLDVQEILRSS